MIKEIRLSWKDIDMDNSDEYLIIKLLAGKGFPVDSTLKEPFITPKDGLRYYEFHDPKTDEIVVQWEG